MKKLTVVVLACMLVLRTSMAELVPGGDFEMYKPGTGYTVLATFGVGNNSFARGVGDGIDLAGGTVSYEDGSPDGVAGDGVPDIDLPGWEPAQSGNDLFWGYEGTTGLHIFAAWGGDGRVQTAGSLGTIESGAVYTIKVLVGGPDDGPIQGPLAFHLMADGVQLTPSEFVDPTLPNGGEFQQISRTYDATSTAGHIGAEMSILLGVEDANDAANRVAFDNVELEVVGGGPGFVITEIEYDAETSMLRLTWNSNPGETYAVKFSEDMSDWEADLDDGVPADAGDTTTAEFDLSEVGLEGAERVFFRVER